MMSFLSAHVRLEVVRIFPITNYLSKLVRRRIGVWKEGAEWKRAQL